MRYVITLFLCALFGLVQVNLWLGESSSYAYTKKLAFSLDQLESKNRQMQLDNLALEAELKDLQSSTEIVEDYARSELGMIKPNEVMIRLK